VPGTEELAFGVPLSFVTWDCSVKDVIPGALVAYGEQGPTGQSRGSRCSSQGVQQGSPSRSYHATS
jgi:hypothetical protein